MRMLKRFLSPAGREKYSDFRKYIVERIPRLYDQVVGRDLRYFPQTKCHKAYIGSRYNGKRICIGEITPASIIYSFGIGRDISFDLTMIERFGVEVYAFDPTPVSKKWLQKQSLPEKFHFFDYGIADYDGFAEFYPYFADDPTAHDYTVLNLSSEDRGKTQCRVYRLETIMNMLEHQKIDILKLDVEGSEYSVIMDIVASKLEVKQFLVEFHHRFENVGIKATDQTIKTLNQNQYKIFSIGSAGYEYSFIRM